MNKIILHTSELPKYIELHGNNGEIKYYKIIPAGRKFGASLNSVVNSEEKLIKKEKQS